jgi:carbonic anhydrase
LSATDDLVGNNERFAREFGDGDLAAAPARKVAVLTCMDARIDPARLLGLQAGDAHVIRNAGGVVTDDAIRSLAISQHLLGTEEIVVIQHTGCGMLAITDEEFAALLESHAGERPPFRAHALASLESGVRESLERISASPFLVHRDKVRGFVYDVQTGRLSEVAAA